MNPGGYPGNQPTGGGRGGAPPPPPPPPGGGHHGGHSHGGGKNHGTGRSNRTRGYRINLAITNLTNALIDKGFTGPQAERFAKFALQQKGVRIGRGGLVHYKGGLYNGADFANSPLLNYVTGAKAKAANEAALKADPNYQMALQQLGLARDQSQATLDSQRTQALTDFGDPSFVLNDPILQQAVAANNFGTSQTLLRNYQQQQRATAQQSNDIGTNLGNSGGLVSGQAENQHVFAGNEANATESLQNLLNSITMQGQQLGQNYALGSQNALLQTQQNLQQQGLLAAHGPKVKLGGTFKLWNARPPRAPAAPRSPGGQGRRVRNPGGTGYPTPNPTGGLF